MRLSAFSKGHKSAPVKNNGVALVLPEHERIRIAGYVDPLLLFGVSFTVLYCFENLLLFYTRCFKQNAEHLNDADRSGNMIIELLQLFGRNP